MKRIIALLLVGLFSFCGCVVMDGPAKATEPETEKVCAVIFDSQGGSTVKTQNVAKGEKAVEPRIPIKKCGCEFVGWYLGNEKWSFAGYTVTEDITLTAKWVKCYDCFGLNYKEYNIIKDLNIFKKYTWQDIEDIRKSDKSNEDVVEYKIIFKDGYIFTITIGKSYV